MSWEVQTVKQKTSFFNWGLSRNILKRTWVLWAAYFAVMLACTAGDISKPAKGISDVFAYTIDYNYSVMRLGINAAQINAFACAVAAMAVFSYMYTSRSCGMINALPIRRETAYITAYLTGLGVLVASNVICAVAVWVKTAQTGYLLTPSIWTLLGFMVLSAAAFYSFASFCAVLTGNIVVLPAVYAVLGCMAFVVISAVGELLADLIYGMASNFIYNGNSDFAYWLSPLVYVLCSKLNIRRVTVYDDMGESSYTGEFEPVGLDVLGIYCAIGLALCVLAVLIYRRRDMERAGDVVAVPVLMPVFKYCMTFGTAILFALVVFHNVLTDVKPGLTTALVIVLLMLIGAAIGYYAAEMLMQKTLKVFSVNCRGLVVSCAILAALALAAEFDAVGYESYVPAAEDVASAEIALSGTNVKFEQAENLEAITKLHEDIIADKEINEAADTRRYLDMVYTLADGSTVSRAYRISYDAAEKLTADSNLRAADALLSTQEAKDYYIGFDGEYYDVNERIVDMASLDGYVLHLSPDDEKYEYENISVDLTPEQAAELYECIKLDSRDSSLGSRWLINDERYYDTVSNLSFYMTLKKHTWETGYDGYRYPIYPCFSISLTMDAERTMKWLADNTELEPMSLAEADPEDAENALQELRTMPTHEVKASAKASVGIIGGADGPTAIFVS